MQTMDEIRRILKEKFKAGEFVIDKTGSKTVEIIGAQFIVTDTALFHEPNEDYIKRELEWYKSQSLYVADIPGKTPVIWEKCASRDGKINSNYGWAILHPDNHNQYENVKRELRRNPDSRRAIMIYTRPSMHYDYNVNGMSDFMCTNNVQYLIRDGELHTIVNMRSNDGIFGFANDFAWQQHVTEKLADDLGVHVGEYIWQAGSLHIYERHFKFLED